MLPQDRDSPNTVVDDHPDLAESVILVVDDKQDVRVCLKRILETSGLQALTAADGVEALQLLESHPVDLILADIIMPNMNGYELYERVIAHPQWVSIPFIFLTARVLDTEIRFGKELGADDYLTKPIKVRDLLAAVRGRLRRAQQLAQSSVPPTSRSTVLSDILVVGQLQIELGQYRVWLNDTEIELSASEFKLLEYLARHADKVVPLQELLKVTHDLDAEYADAGSLLRPLIRSLRRKMGYSAGEMGCIKSVRGVGYRLISIDD